MMPRKAIFILLLATLAAPALQAQTRDQKNKRSRYREEIALINKEIKAAESSGRDATARLQLIKTDISLREALIGEIGARIDSVARAVSLRETAIDSLSRNYEDLQEHFNTLVRAAYKGRSSRSWLLYVFSGSSPAEMVRRGIMLRRLSDSLKDNALKVRAAKAEIALQKDSLSLLMAELEGVRKERETEAETLRRNKGEVESLIVKLRQDKQKYTAELKKKQKELSALENEIEKTIRAAASKGKSAPAKASSGKKGSSKSSSSAATVDNTVDRKMAATFESNKGRLPWPVKGTVCETFGVHKDPVSGGSYNINGVELVTSPSAPVTAVFDGVVEKVSYMDKYYNLVIIRHGTYYTMYCKMGSVSVREGDKIKTGQTIGTVMTAGGQTRFHFELWKGGSSGSQALNPSQWLKR